MRWMAIWSRRKFWPSLDLEDIRVDGRARGPCGRGVQQWLRSGLVLQDGEVKIAAKDESEVAIDTDSGVIVGKAVQAGGFFAGKDIFDDPGHQQASQSPAARVGMGADGADFNVLGQMSTLAGHGDEAILRERSHELA